MKKLSESIFNAGIKRNQGEELRKEDGVNFMNPQKFYEYLMTKYECKSPDSFLKFRVDHLGRPNIHIYIRHKCGMGIFYDNQESQKPNSPIIFADGDLLKKLKSKYEMGLSDDEYIIKSKIKNEDIVKIIDMMIDDNPEDSKVHKKQISESIFNAGIKRNQGEELRKEDDVNLLDRDGLCDYFKSHYEYLCDAPGIDKHYNGGDVLSICTLQYKDHYYRTYTRFGEKGIERICQGIPLGLNNCLNKIFGDKFNLLWTGSLFQITYTDGVISNKILMDVIDRLIEIADSGEVEGIQPLLKKRTN